MSVAKAVKIGKHPFCDSRCLFLMSDCFGVEWPSERTVSPYKIARGLCLYIHTNPTLLQGFGNL